MIVLRYLFFLFSLSLSLFPVSALDVFFPLSFSLFLSLVYFFTLFSSGFPCAMLFKLKITKKKFFFFFLNFSRRGARCAVQLFLIFIYYFQLYKAREASATGNPFSATLFFFGARE